jgi:hypothetical protein
MGLGSCEEHGWVLDEEGCPVCEGMEIVKQRVRELHKPFAGDLYCAECMENEITPMRYPCPTIKALDGEQ